MELIDTQWDVNYGTAKTATFTGYGINRYIVGCKCEISKEDKNWQWGINRYIVGCKYRNVGE